jgi:hypothetical protein
LGVELGAPVSGDLGEERGGGEGKEEDTCHLDSELFQVMIDVAVGEGAPVVRR